MNINKMICSLFFLVAIHGAIDASPFNIIYHGSHLKFDQVEPHQTSRIKEGVKVWEGAAIFGTPDFRISLFYTHGFRKGFGAGIDLINSYEEGDPIIYSIFGGSSEEEALEALWGSFEDSDEQQGWIYILDGRKFHKEPGLGKMEVVTRDVTANIGRISLNRRKEIQHSIDQGLIKIVWSPKNSYKES